MSHDATRIAPLRREPRSERHAALDFVDTHSRVHAAWAEPPRTWPSCSGACDQGRRLCVTPAACRIAEDVPRGLLRRFLSWCLGAAR